MLLLIAQMMLIVGLQAPVSAEQSDASRFGIAGRILKVSQYSTNARPARGRTAHPKKEDLVLVTTFDGLGNETKVEYYADGQLDSYIEKTTSLDRRVEVEHVNAANEFSASVEPRSAPPAPTGERGTWNVHHAESKLARGSDSRLIGEEVINAEMPFLPVGRQISYTYGADGRLAEERVAFRGEAGARVVHKYSYNGTGDVTQEEGYLRGKLSYRNVYSDYVYDTQHNWTQRTVRSDDGSGKVRVSIDLRQLEYYR